METETSGPPASATDPTRQSHAPEKNEWYPLQRADDHPMACPMVPTLPRTAFAPAPPSAAKAAAIVCTVMRNSAASPPMLADNHCAPATRASIQAGLLLGLLRTTAGQKKRGRTDCSDAPCLPTELPPPDHIRITRRHAPCGRCASSVACLS
jgi:hypothetical protein